RGTAARPRPSGRNSDPERAVRSAAHPPTHPLVLRIAERPGSPPRRRKLRRESRRAAGKSAPVRGGLPAASGSLPGQGRRRPRPPVDGGLLTGLSPPRGKLAERTTAVRAPAP